MTHDPVAWQRIDPTNIEKVGYRTVVSKTFRLPDGSQATFQTVHKEGTQLANALAFTPDNKVILVRQFRPGPEKVMHELPGGFVDEGETPEEAVVRELEEETGYQPGTIVKLGETHKDAYLNGKWYSYLITDCQPTGVQALGETEHVEVELVTIDELIDLAKHDAMTDTTTILLAYDTLLKMKGHTQ